MKIKDENEFWEFADNWYHRTHRLREVWQDVNESQCRRLKAFELWNVMYSRVMRLHSIAVNLIPKFDPKHGKFVIPDGGLDHVSSEKNIVSYFNSGESEKIQLKSGKIIDLGK